jgi:hypothetical protein
MGRGFALAPSIRLLNRLLDIGLDILFYSTSEWMYIAVLSLACVLQLDFSATVSALLGLPFPFGRCSVRILSRCLFTYSMFLNSVSFVLGGTLLSAFEWILLTYFTFPLRYLYASGQLISLLTSVPTKKENRRC